MASDLLRVAELDLAEDDVAALRTRAQKISRSGLWPVSFDDRWGAVAKTLRDNIDDPEEAEREALTTKDGGGLDALRFAELSALAKGMVPKTQTHTGTGLYATKATPTKIDDVQDGAPSGQVITLVTGGLGTADAFKGGYVKNMGIVAGSDDQPTATSNNTPAGHAWAASIDTSAAAWKAADDSAATSWLDTWTGPEWWEYTPPSSKTYGKVSIQAKSVIVAGRLPKDFKAQGWNGSTWIDLLTITGETGWSASEKRSWEFTSNIAPYSKYRLYITANNGDSFIEIGEVEWFATTEETRAIVSHTDDTVTLEGILTNWTDTDLLEVYDAWSMIQAALDQMWTDQGSATFTSTQIMRIFAGTYNENVIPNAGFDPDETNGFQLVIEGDPDDDREDILIQPTAGTDGIYVNCDSAIIRHLKVASAVVTAGIRSYTGNTWLEVTDCDVPLTTAGNVIGIYPRGRAVIEDCDVSIQAQGSSAAGIFSYGAMMIVRRCKVIGNGGSAVGIMGRSGHVVESCIVSDFLVGFGDYQAGPQVGPNQIRNSVAHDCTYGIWHANFYHPTLDIVNTIFDTCTNVFTIQNAMPEWSATNVIGDIARLLNCCFYNYTTFAKQWVGGGDKTYAEFIALNRVTAAGNLDQVNPLLTNPGTGDFSLQAGSPCINTGHGSGVTSDYLGVAFDGNNPDIGAWSSGAVSSHLVPVIDSWANVGDGDAVTLTVSNVETFRTIHIFYRLFGGMAAFAESPTTRVGPGDVTLSGLEDGLTYEIFAISSNGTSSNQPSLPSNTVLVTPSVVTAGAVTALENQGGRDLQLDNDCKDIEIVNLDLALVDGTVQVKQALCIALRLFRGEWFLDANAGVPYYQDVLVKSPNLSEINSILKTEILKVEHVNKILEFTSTFDSVNRQLSVSFRADTTFGPVTIEETL
jgi:hypothetical protein